VKELYDQVTVIERLERKESVITMDETRLAKILSV
jgi:hypothetical protein